MSELLIDLAFDESEVNSPIKATQQEVNNERIYVQNSKRVNVVKNCDRQTKDMKVSLGSKARLRKTGTINVDSEVSAKVVNSAKQKQHVEEVMDMGQDDD